MAGSVKSFPVQRDEHLMTVLRYVLQNPVRAGSSSTVQEWLWSSMRRRHLVDRSSVDEAGQWSEQLKNQLGDAQVANIRECRIGSGLLANRMGKRKLHPSLD
jgi:putative transposase